jgi:hypothetical protein
MGTTPALPHQPSVLCPMCGVPHQWPESPPKTFSDAIAKAPSMHFERTPELEKYYDRPGRYTGD